jgi:hypothetical protein
MSTTFDIQIDLNGWLIPFQIERKGAGTFKVIFENLSLGFVLLNNSSQWIYLQKTMRRGLLNKQTTDKICEAIKYY